MFKKTITKEQRDQINWEREKKLKKFQEDLQKNGAEAMKRRREEREAKAFELHGSNALPKQKKPTTFLGSVLSFLNGD